MNRREAFRIIGAGALTGGIAAGAVAAVVPASAASPISADLAAAIEAHRAAVRHDESLYGGDAKPLVSLDALDASDEALAEAFLSVAAVPCRSMQDVADKVRYILAGPGELRGDARWSDEHLSALTGPDGADINAPDGPLSTFLRSLLPPDAHA